MFHIPTEHSGIESVYIIYQCHAGSEYIIKGDCVECCVTDVTLEGSCMLSFESMFGL